ncbi:phytase [Sphingomonas hylomeconis]|uniref:Phytase n=1 Tax=Sphingomonas hylomeconis TaxID=1395958 RepID=A0ABV7SVU5_9SPHN
MRALLPLILLAGCAGATETPPASTLATASVTARGETDAVGTANADAADDPAIWRNAADPAASLIVGTDKKAGLYVYGLDGKARSFLDAGRVNNVDLRSDVRIAGTPGVLVAASDRSDKAQAMVALFRLDTATAKLVPLAKLPAGAGEAYGMCLYRSGDAVFAFLVMKDGTIAQMALDLSGATPTGKVVRRMKLGTQSEGCVADDRTGRLYVAEEDVGLWRFDAALTGSATPVPIAKADGQQIVADAEGVALAGEYVVVSSQGDNAYAVYRLDDDSYVGRFRIAAGTIDGTSETDGIEIARGDFGPAFPGGLMVVQDGDNAPDAQNFKLVAWDDVAAALKRD